MATAFSGWTHVLLALLLVAFVAVWRRREIPALMSADNIRNMRSTLEAEEMNSCVAELRGSGAAELSSKSGPCSGCGEMPADGQFHQACAACKMAFYCSKSCQKQDWKKHKHVCKTFAAMRHANDRSQRSTNPSKLQMIGSGDFTGFSDAAQAALFAEKELGGNAFQQIRWQKLPESSEGGTAIRQYMLQQLGNCAGPVRPGRVQLALGLVKSLLLVIGPASAHCEAESHKRHAMKKVRRGVVVVECNDIVIEDLMAASGNVPVALGIFYLSLKSVQEYFVKRNMAMKAAAKDPSNLGSEDYYMQGATSMVQQFRDADGDTMPVVVSYRHREDDTGFAISWFLMPTSRSSNEGAFACLLQDVSLHRAQALRLELPACALTLFDFDQDSFIRLVGAAPSDETTSVHCSDSTQLQCMSCKRSLGKNDFSNAQRKKSAEVRRCRSCAVSSDYNTGLDVMISGFDKMSAAAADTLEDPWLAQLKAKGLAPSPQEAAKTGKPIDPEQLMRFVLQYMPQLAPIAAGNFSRAGKGALFVFSRIAFDDLTDLVEGAEDTTLTPGPRGAHALDRMFMIVWGSQKAHGRCSFTANGLSKHFRDCVTTLPKNMNACSREHFPLVICCDPSGAYIPDDLTDHVRGPKTSARKSYARQSPFVGVSLVRFFDFDAFLELANESGATEQDGMALNMDRHYTDPDTS